MALGESYEEFVEKFKPKKTTDDCYTPPAIYEAVKGWAVKEYGIDPEKIVRPFYPGGDYEHFEYPEGCVVLDNPPFSILSKILRFYDEHKIAYFLFAPTLTLPKAAKGCALAVGAAVEYENGAKVNTSFCTNLEGDILRSVPDLRELLDATGERMRAEKRKEIPKYDYPVHVITAARAAYYAKHGVQFRVRREDGVRISAMDAQREKGKAVFGGGYLLSERAAAERAAAERAAAERAAAYRWELSERERRIVAEMSREED